MKHPEILSLKPRSLLQIQHPVFPEGEEGNDPLLPPQLGCNPLGKGHTAAPGDSGWRIHRVWEWGAGQLRGLCVPGRDKSISQEGNKTQAWCIPSPKQGVKQPSEEGGMCRALPTARGMDDLSNTIPV